VGHWGGCPTLLVGQLWLFIGGCPHFMLCRGGQWLWVSVLLIIHGFLQGVVVVVHGRWSCHGGWLLVVFGAVFGGSETMCD
jgi:ABC-type transport system involved in cytochrome c biogenesis permease subunit